MDEGIWVIVVFLGDEYNVDEVKIIVFIKEDVIRLNVIDELWDIVDKIIDNIFDGELRLMLRLMFYLF